jgi:hypothetical protein
MESIRIYINKMEDIDADVLKASIIQSAEHLNETFSS